MVGHRELFQAAGGGEVVKHAATLTAAAAVNIVVRPQRIVCVAFPCMIRAAPTCATRTVD